MKLTKKQLEILDIYYKRFDELKRLPSRTDMSQVGVSFDCIRRAFSNLTELKLLAMKLAPEKFIGMINHNKTKNRLKRINKYKRFVITTAVAGGSVFEPFLVSVRKYCKENEALLIVLPIGDINQVSLDGNMYIDPLLSEEVFVFEDLRLNENLFISSIKVSAKQINPLTGLRRIGQRNGSFIFASPKQFLESAAISNSKIPSVLMTTGACTIPNYSTNKYLGKRTAYISNHDHVLGAIVVEVESRQVFHFRQLQSDVDGGIVDLGVYYSGDSEPERMAPRAFVAGDWHVGDTNPQVRKNWMDLCNDVGVEELILHDVFNGKSINHHEVKNLSAQAIKAKAGQLDLKNEVILVAEELKELLLSGIKRLVIVKSNHDEFLDRYLESGRYITDPHNLGFSLTLVEGQISGLDPLKLAVEKVGVLSADQSQRIVWLKRDDDYKIGDIECGSHGDKGANGSRGGLSSLETAYGNGVFGHVHSPKIVRGVWMVGTSTYLKVGYNVGPSGWANSGVLVYKNGCRQMIFSIYGKYKIKIVKKKT